MKRHLKFLLLSTLTSIPIVSVVACSSSDSTSYLDHDVLNSAEGAVMVNQTFNMNADLGLINIPENNSNYTTINTTVRNMINNRYSELVASGNLNWPNKTVAVNIRNVKSSYVYNSDTKTNERVESDTAFSAKYGKNVEARIDLTADLKYKNLTTSVPIVVIITNDKSSPQEKIDAIGAYLTDYLNNNDEPFEFQTLFKNNLSSDDIAKGNIYGQIAANLSDTLFNSTSPIIDVADIHLDVLPITAGENQTFYSLTDVAAVTDPDNSSATIGVINGTLQNLTLQITDTTNNKSSNINLSDLTSQNLKIRQRFTDATNQISGILNQGADALWFIDSDLPSSELPTAGETLSDYDTDGSFTTKITEKLFTLITEIYPSSIMGASWVASAITIPTASSSQFVWETDPNGANQDGTNNGYFTVNVQFSYSTDNGNILSSIGDLRLNLKTTTSS